LIKIISGWSNPGGSTVAFINLCNLFNEKGYTTTFYGPHQWHLDKCSADVINNIQLNSDDIIIYHFLNVFDKRPPVKKFVLSLHEKDLYPLKTKPLEIFDSIHFLNEKQFKWHGVQPKSYFFCPNAHEDLKPFEGQKVKCAGIIGNIDRNKNVHISIQRALDDGHTKIRLFGNNHDPQYWQELVEPLIKANSDTVKFIGFVENKKDIYDLVTDVYHSSTSENASFIVDECKLADVTLHGNEQTIAQPLIPNDNVFEIWKKEIL